MTIISKSSKYDLEFFLKYSFIYCLVFFISIVFSQQLFKNKFDSHSQVDLLSTNSQYYTSSESITQSQDNLYDSISKEDINLQSSLEDINNFFNNNYQSLSDDELVSITLIRNKKITEVMAQKYLTITGQ